MEVVTALDSDAIARIGGDLSAVVELDDLRAAGWSVDGPTDDSDGFTRLRVSREFGNPEEAAAIFDEIAGEEGPFQDFAVTHEDSFASTEWGFTGRVDFSGGLEALGDEGLAAELDGEPLGLSVEEIEERLGDSLSRVVQVRVGVRLPGDVSSNATTQADNGAVWQVGFGEGAVDMEATGSERRTATLVLIGVAVVLAVALVVLLLVRLAMRSTDRRRTPDQADP
ncbi:MAG TPA: hypothetical protein VIR58_11350 [Acidimicrobiales bacterium]